MRAAGWASVAVTVAVIVVVVIFMWPSNAPAPEQQPTAMPDHVSALEEQLRAKGSAEDALTRYEATLQATADDLTKLMPATTWRWNRDPDYLGCSGEFGETRGVRFTTRNLLSDKPIPDNLWPWAVELATSHAAGLGATRMHVNADQPGNHDVAVVSQSGAELRLTSRGRAVLTAISDCYLRRADLPQ